jgi:hypothetical protein
MRFGFCRITLIGVSRVRYRYFLVPAILTLPWNSVYAAETPTAQISAVSDLASLLDGEFTTAPAPDATAPHATAANPPARVLYDRAKRVDIATLGHDTVYTELREGGSDGPLVSQTLYALKPDEDSGRIVMTVYSIPNPQELAGVLTDTTPLPKLNPSGLKPKTGCDIIWRKVDDGFVGSHMPGTCGTALDAKLDTPAMSVSKTGLSRTVNDSRSEEPVMFRRVR